MNDTLSRRALNRATLSRQLLLRRAELSVAAAVEHLVGLQAQTPHTWYVGLWSRLNDFRGEEAGDLLLDRRLVRIALMRSTIHLVTAADCLALRPLIMPVMERWFRTGAGKGLAGIERDELVAAGRALIEERPLTFAALGARLADRWPARDPALLAQAIRAWVPLVQVPPRGVWGRSGPIAHTSAESWLDAPLDPRPSLERMVVRYLAAFGPASVNDIQTWSGLTGLRSAVESIRHRLTAFRDEHGRELLDLPEAHRPHPDTPAPPRFLYDFDNLLLSHADRSRVITDELRRQAFDPHGPIPQLVLVDGFSAGDWTVTRKQGAATLTIRPWIRVSREDAAGLVEEGGRLLEFVASAADTRDVQLLPPTER